MNDPSNYFQQLCTLSTITVASGSLLILDEVKRLDLLLSSAKQRSDDVDSRSTSNISVVITPVVVFISKHRVMKIQRIISAFNSIITICKTVDNGFLEECCGPRIEDFAKISLNKIRAFGPSMEILLLTDCENEYRNDTDWRIMLQEIMNSFLIQKLSSIQRNAIEMCEATDAALNIALNRMRGLDLADYQANIILEKLTHEAERLTINNEIESDSSKRNTIIDSVIDDLLSETSLFVPVTRSTYTISLSFGFRIYVDKKTYDWRLSLSLSSLVLRSRAGVSILRVAPNKNIFESANLDDDEEHDATITNDDAVSANIVWKELNLPFGEGGSPMSVCAEDRFMKSTSEESKELLIYFSIGTMELLFVEDEILSAMTFVSGFNDKVCSDSNNDGGDSLEAPITTSISGNISECNILCCAKNYEPFTKLFFQRVAVDVSSNPSLFDDGKFLLFSTCSKTVQIFDLTVDGQVYDQVVIGTGGGIQDADRSDPFSLKLAISSDQKVSPTELLIVFAKSKLFILRRFLNELLQFLFSPDHGIGRILDQCSDHVEKHDEQPLRFQIHILDSSIILPKSSDSDDLLAISLSKLILSNSFEKQSWSVPKVNVNGCPQQYTQRCSTIGEVADEYTTDYLFECNPFDKSLVSRISTTVMNANIFTGISKKEYLNGDRATTYQIIKRAISIGEIRDGSTIFFLDPHESISTIKDSECGIISDLLERQWEKVTVVPMSLEVITDFLPSHMRVLIKDTQSNIDPDVSFSLNLRMSQFYAILSTWYENMQELPMLFPYSPESIQSQVISPECPVDWPEYGSESYVKRMSSLNKVIFELAFSLTALEWHCQFDNEHYFERKIGSAFMMNPSADEELILRATNLTIQVDMDADEVMRTGLGATSLVIDDKRHSHTVYPRAFDIPQIEKDINSASIDMTWGLRCGKNISSKDLNFPFQVSVFMTPDRWCLVNLAMEDLDTCTADLGFLWVLLDYFTSYFSYGEFGNPYFKMKESCEAFVNEIFDVDNQNEQEDSLSIDFRLWLLRPRVAILCDPVDALSPVFVIKSNENGLFYRYKTIGNDFVSQEMCSCNLDMLKLDSCNALTSNVREIVCSEKWISMLFRSLNMSLMYDQHTQNNHIDIHVDVMQQNDEIRDNNGIEFPPVRAIPVDIPLPTICKPSFTPSHQLGPISCEIELMNPDDFIMASGSLSKFAGPYAEEESGDESKSNLSGESSLSYSFFLNLGGSKIFISDPLLGVHLPVVVVNIPSLKINCSQLFCMNGFWEGISNASDWQNFVDAHFWVDYYKSGQTRSWEPLVEPYKCVILIEKSTRRGHGITVTSSSCPFHINMSGAFFETLAFAARSFAPYILHLLGINEQLISVKEKGQKGFNSDLNLRMKHPMVHEYFQKCGIDAKIKHEKVSTLNSSEPAAFSLINLTGDEVRFHQHVRQDSGKYIQYLHHRGAAALSFPATRSLVMNLKIVEIPVYKNGDQIVNGASSGRVDSSNYIDVQIPGFCWTKSISVDVTGKRFVGLQPKSSPLQVRCVQINK